MVTSLVEMLELSNLGQKTNSTIMFDLLAKILLATSQT